MRRGLTDWAEITSLTLWQARVVTSLQKSPLTSVVKSAHISIYYTTKIPYITEIMSQKDTGENDAE